MKTENQRAPARIRDKCPTELVDPKVIGRKLRVAEAPGKERYARLNKNFVVQDAGLGHIVAAGANGRDLFWLFAFLAEAQRLDQPRVSFRSEYEALKCFGLPTESQEREVLRKALEVWRVIGFDFERWFHAEETKPIGHMEKKAKAKLKHQRKAKQTRPRMFERVWKFRRSMKGPRFSVTFDKAFWEANCFDGFYCRAFLDVARAVRYPHIILLALLIDAKSGVINEWHPETLAEKIGLSETKPGRRLKSLQRAVEAIEDATGQQISFRVLKDGKLHIRREKDNDTQEKPKRSYAASRVTSSTGQRFDDFRSEYRLKLHKQGKLPPEDPPDPEDAWA